MRRPAHAWARSRRRAARRRRGLEHFAHHEAHDGAGLASNDDPVDQARDGAREPVARFARRQRLDCARFARGGGENLRDRRDREIGARSPKALLAAEMISDSGDVDVRFGGDLPGRGRLEAPLAEEVERRADERRTGRLGAQERGRFAPRDTCS